ncbi:MAG: peptidase T, partial [Thermoplasmata archaeon]|nr:peptidase T [Thermoplasmata archaeon]
EDSERYPSTEKQCELARLLEQELNELGLVDVKIDEHCYVTATLPGNTPAPVIGFISHMDTSPESPGGGVKPIIHRNYDGGKIVLPGDPTQILDPAEDVELKKWVGTDIITSDGTTLLGADDKAGVAEIMTMLSYLVKHPEIPHGEIKVAFTPDEEVGAGTKYFDVDKFGAELAYTVDGGDAGTIDLETFNAASATFTFIGKEVHPGYAKDKMINSIRMAAHAITMLPPYEAPETTENHQGYLHPYVIQGGVEKSTLKVLLRDFTLEGLSRRKEIIKDIARKVEALFPGGKVEVEIKDQYRNMREHLKKRPEVIEKALQAIKLAGIEPVESIVRGGTDGAMLSERGLPTPNIFTGGYNFHSRREWIPVEAMVYAVKTLIYLSQLYTQRSNVGLLHGE